jgi:hypothetical protein
MRWSDLEKIAAPTESMIGDLQIWKGWWRQQAMNFGETMRHEARKVHRKIGPMRSEARELSLVNEKDRFVSVDLSKTSTDLG